MRIKKVKKQTKHSIERFGERFNISNETQILAMCKNASEKGIPPLYFKGSDFYNYLLTKGTKKRIKIYKGRIYIFSKNSNRCYTVYPVPDEFLETYKQYEINYYKLKGDK